ncbi:MAG: uroporphyrinogen-III C-methyltransferase [Acidimicrobiaceae bacterium]|nr:uroporphyrinogen-III C-methyltransferase [Acidimicrobiaceae bacterium]
MSGHIALVGAGPGDPELLTVRAARLIASADVVVHDALVSDDVLALVSPAAELINVGKRPGQGVAQELTNELLILLATDGKRVVRLKGGDPFVFGRGGEEAVALAAAGFTCEIVPGITSAIAAPAAAGIPVTYRGLSASFTVVTGHRQFGEKPVNWRALAQSEGTLVILMGVAERGVIATELMDGGLAAHTPVAAIRLATTSDQFVVRCRLDGLAELAIESPATLVIGAVAALNVTESLSATGAQEHPPHSIRQFHQLLSRDTPHTAWPMSMTQTRYNVSE